MREIKLKAWDKRQKQMSAVFTLTELTQYEHIFEVKFKYLARFNDLIWLEYTGLKDKNGTEIYEGDIVHLEGHKRNHKIIYTSGSFVGKQTKGKFQGYLDGLFFYRTEVIGNIYENPELLEVK